jgi:hypothetical protein
MYSSREWKRRTSGEESSTCEKDKELMPKTPCNCMQVQGYSANENEHIEMIQIK